MSIVWPKTYETLLLPSRGSDAVATYPCKFTSSKGYAGSVDQRCMSIREPYGPYASVMRTRIIPGWIGTKAGAMQPEFMMKAKTSGNAYQNQRELYDLYDSGSGGVGEYVGWSVAAFNRVRFQIKLEGVIDWENSSYSRETGFSNSFSRGPGNVGGYQRFPITSNSQKYYTDYGPSHSYHFFTMPKRAEMGWFNVMICRQPDVLENDPESIVELHVEPYALQGYPGLNYFDVLSDMYYQFGLSLLPHTGADAAYMYTTPMEWFNDDTSLPGNSGDLEHRVGSLQCNYDAGENRMEVGASLTNDLVDGNGAWACLIAYKFGATTYGDSFDGLAQLGQYERTSHENEYVWYNNDFAFDWDALGGAGHDVVYIALAVAGKEVEWGHREFPVCRDHTQLPPLPGENPA